MGLLKGNRAQIKQNTPFKHQAKFKIGDFVLAKMRGYSPWPAQVIKKL